MTSWAATSREMGREIAHTKKDTFLESLKKLKNPYFKIKLHRNAYRPLINFLPTKKSQLEQQLFRSN